ncbi:hypothetical protein ADK41_27365 [Streptomyces caelestis]|uniref:Uncharacterized protein n=1 Tax=Streptomyces caelestis TaxID=36816 RepID=A0A0M9X6R6_9ACTN|nr:hypothetical protein ADK41_27365 [Streptomyces caelestis]
MRTGLGPTRGLVLALVDGTAGPVDVAGPRDRRRVRREDRARREVNDVPGGTLVREGRRPGGPRTADWPA